MIFAAYASLLIAVWVYLRGSESIPPRHEALVRVFGVLVGLGFTFIGLVLLGGEGATTLGNIALLLLVLGGVLYAWGLVRWRTPDGLGSRRVGWILVVAALSVPSTLTLLLPIASLLVLTLRPVLGLEETAEPGSPLDHDRLDDARERIGRDALHEAENRLR